MTWKMKGRFGSTEGVGSRIISECAACLKQWGFQKIRLAIDQGNPQSKAFWMKNRFAFTGEAFSNENGAYLPMEKMLGWVSASKSEGAAP